MDLVEFIHGVLSTSLTSACYVGCRNLALGKPTEQSSVYTEGTVPVFSSGAVDGNRGGYYGVHPITITNSDSPSWWEIDLE